MLVIIKKDDATSVPREVADLAEARALAAGGMPVFVQNEDGSTTAVGALTEDEPEVASVEVTPAKKKSARKS